MELERREDGGVTYLTLRGQFETFSLPTPFLVIATQNPIEQSGTFELPEAQLDRFMLCHRLAYPTVDEAVGTLEVHDLFEIFDSDQEAALYFITGTS